MREDAVRLLPADDGSWDLTSYLRRGGYASARKAVTAMAPADIIAEVRKAGLRGRGGAGFPAGLKWSFVPQGGAGPKYLCVNADEGEPGTFKDRAILVRNPHLLLEGMVIAAFAVGIRTAVVYVRGEYDRVADRLARRSPRPKRRASSARACSARTSGSTSSFIGDLFCVFYAGYGHVSLPKDGWPKGGRICWVRAGDEGRSWGAPRVLFDGPYDDRDPHVAQMSDGTVVCSFFTYRQEEGRILCDTCLVTSRDGGATWEAEPRIVAPGWRDLGLPVAGPVHEVTLSPFHMDAHEVTWAEWTAVMSWAVDPARGSARYQFRNAGAGSGPDHPVVMIDWF